MMLRIVRMLSVNTPAMCLACTTGPRRLIVRSASFGTPFTGLHYRINRDIFYASVLHDPHNLPTAQSRETTSMERVDNRSGRTGSPTTTTRSPRLRTCISRN